MLYNVTLYQITQIFVTQYDIIAENIKIHLKI